MLVGIIIVGLIASVLLSRDTSQKIATAIAFASLIVIGILFYVVVIGLGNTALFPLFAALCLVVPIGLYLLLRLRASKKPAAHQKAAKGPKQAGDAEAAEATRLPEPPPSLEPAAGVSASPLFEPTPGTAPALEPIADVSASPSLEPTPLPEFGSESGYELAFEIVPEPAPEPAPEPEPATQSEPEFAPEPIAQPVVEYLTAAVPVPSPQPEPEPAAQPEPEPVAQPVPSPQPEPRPEPAAQPEPESEPEPAAQPEPEPAAQPPQTEASTEPLEHFESYYNQAESYKQKGAHATAAQLFEESVYHTDNLDLIHKSVFAAMNAYLKAGQKDDVRRLALILQESGTLQPIQEKKLSAILRML
ncbi:MAG: hypothetical protein LBP28_07865 [Coriobacteriales bacterium]|nr:hypothetical protein [Coriobacteriales bacterium]